GDAVQIVDTVYGVRSFMNQADFFYVLQETDNTANAGATSFNMSRNLTFPRQPFKPGILGILQPSPQTTMSTTSATSGVNYTIGGSIGYNQQQGFNASIS